MKKKKLKWSTTTRKVSNLIPNENNPRVTNSKQDDDLKKSIDEFDLVEIPVIDLDDHLIAGHQRVRIMKESGRGNEEIEVRIPNRKLTQKEYDKYLLISNRVHGDFDWDKLIQNYDITTLFESGFDIDLSNILDDTLEVEDDNFQEEEEIEKALDTNIKIGDYFQLGNSGYLLCADSTDPETVKKLMNGVKVDLVNDDVPYNIGLKYDRNFSGKKVYGGKKTDDNKSEGDYRKFVKSIMQNALSVCKPDAHIFFWADERWVFLLQELYKELNIDSKRLCIWLKQNQSPTPQIAFNKITEFICYGTIGRPWLNEKITNLHEIQNKEVTTGNRLSEDILDLLNIWMVPRISTNEYQHPTQKPPTVHEKSLRRCTRVGDVVLDLTCGSGSLLSACHQLKRKVYLCDYEPVFTQVVINRFKQLAPNEKVIKLN